MPYYCNAPTEDGTPCRHKVKARGQRCGQHRGFRTAPSSPRSKTVPRSSISAYPTSAVRSPAYRPAVRQPTRPAQSKPPPTFTRKEQERARVQGAAKFCADFLSATWQDAVADRIADYAGTTWERLKRSRRHRRRCKALARLAAAILEGKQKLHELVGRAVGWFAGFLGADDFTREFAAELATNIPLGPIDAKAVAVARGLQVSGIVLCLINDDDITKCQCFIDLALTETKERVKQILVSAMSDWSSLSKYTSSHPAK